MTGACRGRCNPSWELQSFDPAYGAQCPKSRCAVSHRCGTCGWTGACAVPAHCTARHRVSRGTVVRCIRKCLQCGLEAALGELPRRASRGSCQTTRSPGRRIARARRPKELAPHHRSLRPRRDRTGLLRRPVPRRQGIANARHEGSRASMRSSWAASTIPFAKDPRLTTSLSPAMSSSAATSSIAAATSPAATAFASWARASPMTPRLNAALNSLRCSSPNEFSNYHSVICREPSK